MTVTTQDKHGAYAQHQRQNEDGRETDKRALLMCASRLHAAIETGGKDMPTYSEAIRQNQRLWTIFQVALTDPDNALPRELKMTLLNLSRYVDRVSFRAMVEFAPQLLHSLIEINRAIAAGLARKVAQQAQTQAQAPAYATSAPVAPPQMPAGPVVTTA